MIRLLRIEIRRNATPWVLPLLAALLAITPLARDLVPVALWLDRSVDVAGSVQLIGPFAAGTAAWMASRAHRRGATDLLASTPRSPWSRALATWLGCAGWTTAFYFALCVVFLSITAGQATWGSPQWWPVAVGLVATVTCSALGFALGLWFPSRFTTPLVAVGVLALILGSRASVPDDRSAGIGLLSPIFPTFGLNASVFYRPLPDLAILHILLCAGVLALALGAVAWRGRGERPALQRGAAALLAAGLVLTTTATVLGATARVDGPSVAVPAFHTDAGQAVPYTPVCSHTPLPVCVHPAYAGGHELTVLAAIINDVARPVLNVPGMPIRAEQRAADGTFGVRGEVLPFQNFIVHGTTLQPPAFDRAFRSIVALALFLGPHTRPEDATPVQRALALWLVRQAHYPPTPTLLSPNDPDVAAAAARFAALTPGARTAWLTDHLARIRAGQLTTKDIP